MRLTLQNTSAWLTRGTIKVPADRTLEAELAMLGPDDDYDMANLSEEQTGVPGNIFISTQMGKHAARVKYQEKKGKTQPSFSMVITDSPHVVASNLPKLVCERMEPIVAKWVILNKDELLRYWYEGVDFDENERAAFMDGIKRI
ncbi:hypothetical protein [Methylorubrum extorquens]